MKHREHDMEKLARARLFFEKKGANEHVFTYHNLRWFGKMRILVDEDIQLSPEYIEETRTLVEGMLSRFTTLTLTYDDNSTFQEVKDIVQGWGHVDTLEINEAEHRIILEGEKEVLERVKVYLEEIVRGWKEDSLQKTKRWLQKKRMDLNRITDPQLEILDKIRNDQILYNCVRTLFSVR